MILGLGNKNENSRIFPIEKEIGSFINNVIYKIINFPAGSICAKNEIFNINIES